MAGWKQELEWAITEFLIVHGKLVKESAQGKQGYGIYTWDDHRDQEFADRHAWACGIRTSAWQDNDWVEWEGTFADEPWSQREGTELTLTCNCGLLEARVWRYTGGLADMIKAITK